MIKTVPPTAITPPQRTELDQIKINLGYVALGTDRALQIYPAVPAPVYASVTYLRRGSGVTA